MNKLLKEILDKLHPQLRDLDFIENIDFSLSKLPDWDLQINYLIR
jgi:hypothetical protein